MRNWKLEKAHRQDCQANLLGSPGSMASKLGVRLVNRMLVTAAKVNVIEG